MQHNCLVLNKSYIPIETITWQDAFRKIFNGQAYPIEFYDDQIVRTPNDEFLKPAVIVCVEYNGIPSRVVVYSKRLVCRRDGWMCMYCGISVNPTTFSVDHIVPRSQGGRSTFENTVCACKPCNARKANRTPKQANMKLRCTPIKPRLNPIKAKFERMKLEAEWRQYVECHLK